MAYSPEYKHALHTLQAPDHVRDILYHVETLLDSSLLYETAQPPHVAHQGSEGLQARWDHHHFNGYDRLALTLGARSLMIATEHMHDDTPDILLPRASLFIQPNSALVYELHPSRPISHDGNGSEESLSLFRERLDHVTVALGLSRAAERLQQAS